MGIPRGTRRDETIKKALLAKKRYDQGVPLAIACRANGISPGWFFRLRKEGLLDPEIKKENV